MVLVKIIKEYMNEKNEPNPVSHEGILDSLETEYSTMNYEDARNIIDRPIHRSNGEPGDPDYYQIEINASYDNPIADKGDIRVMISIDYGTNAMTPVTRDLIIKEVTN
jgi:hypothetical protein